MIARIVAVLAASAALAAGAQSPADFAYRLPLATAGSAAFFRVDLPAAVYEGALRADLGDVRVFNGSGAAVPVAFLAQPATAREPVAAATLPLFPLRVETSRPDLGDVTLKVRRDASGTSVDLATRDGAAVTGDRLAGYLVDATETKIPLAALVLALPEGVNVATRVRVEGSDDLAAWRTLAEATPVLALDYAGRRITRDRIDLNGASAKYLRIAFEPGQPTPEFASIRGEFADRVIDAPRRWTSAEGVADKEAAGAYTFDLGGQFPVDRLRLELPEINTVAPATVLARATPQAPWREIATTVFYRLRQEGGDAVSPPLALGNAPLRYWRIAVDPKSGGLGTGAPKLVAGWIPASLVFAARGDGPFELAYGSAQAKAVTLPLDTLVPAFDARTTPATFGVATPGEARSPPAMAALEKPLDVKRWLLWCALGLATLVLGFMAYALMRQMKVAPPSASGAVGAAPPPEPAPPQAPDGRGR